MHGNLNRGVAATPPRSLLSALKRLLRPLVRLLLGHQISYPMMTRILKAVYVEVATENFQVEGKAQTDSRISLLTGVHRKDVKRLRSETAEHHEIPASVPLSAQLVALWTGDSKYIDADGVPKPLTRLPRKGERMSFERLVRTVNKDIRPRVVLDEWLRLGIAKLDEDDRVWLDLQAFVPKKGFDEKAFYFGQNLHDHIAAGAHNLLGDVPAFLDRSAFSDALSPESAAELAALAEKKGMETLLAISRCALKLERKDASGSAPKKRINFGIYFYEDADRDSAQGK